MFSSRTVPYYDAIYRALGKDYAVESRTIHAMIEGHRRTPGTTLLDVACGTGGHIEHLKKHYRITGLDIDELMLEIVRGKFPNLRFVQGDMETFSLDERFHAVVCLFSSIGYMRTVDRLNRAVASMAAHLEPGGVLIVEPWLTPETYRPGGVHAVYVDEPDLKVARVNRTEVVAGASSMEFHYLIGTPEAGVEHVVERHELGLFTHNEYMSAFSNAGLETSYDPVGLLRLRGLYIGVRPL